MWIGIGGLENFQVHTVTPLTTLGIYFLLLFHLWQNHILKFYSSNNIWQGRYYIWENVMCQKITLLRTRTLSQRFMWKVWLKLFIHCEFNSYLCHLLAVQPCASYLTSLCFHCNIYKMRLITVLFSWDCWCSKWFNTSRGLRMVPGTW